MRGKFLKQSIEDFLQKFLEIPSGISEEIIENIFLNPKYKSNEKSPEAQENPSKNF